MWNKEVGSLYVGGAISCGMILKRINYIESITSKRNKSLNPNNP